VSNLDLILLSKTIREGNFGDLAARGLSEKHLATGEGNIVYGFLQDYYENAATRGQTPSLSMVSSYFPEIELPDPGSARIQDLVAACKQGSAVREARALGARMSRDLTDNYNPNILSYLAGVQEQIAELLNQGHENADSSVDTGVRDTAENYDKGLRGELPVLPWPWPELRRNRWTLGMEDEDYAILYGRPKNKKSFLLLFFVSFYFLSGYPVLVYSKEMPKEQIWRRVLAFLANLPYTDLTTYNLSHSDYARMKQTVADVEMMVQQMNYRLICVSGQDAPSRMDSVAWLLGKIRHYRPRIVVVDGIYLMSSPQKTKADHERVQGISRALRSVALYEHVPVLGTIQANRKVSNKAAIDDTEGESDDVAFSDSVGQDCTHLMRVAASKVDNTATILWRTSRETAVPNFRINAVPCTDFSFLEAIQESQAQRVIQEDDESTMDPPTYTPPEPQPKPRRKKVAADDALSDQITALVGSAS